MRKAQWNWIVVVQTREEEKYVEEYNWCVAYILLVNCKVSNVSTLNCNDKKKYYNNDNRILLLFLVFCFLSSVPFFFIIHFDKLYSVSVSNYVHIVSHFTKSMWAVKTLCRLITSDYSRELKINNKSISFGRKINVSSAIGKKNNNKTFLPLID